MTKRIFKSALAALVAVSLLSGPALAVKEQQAEDTFWLWQAAKNYFSVVNAVFGTEDGTTLRPAYADDGKDVLEIQPAKDGPRLDVPNETLSTE